jgi:hypothetical protein
MESGEHERLSQFPGGTLSENQRRLAYPLQHESEVQASITGAVLVHDRSPHLRVSDSPSSCEVNWPASRRPVQLPALLNPSSAPSSIASACDLPGYGVSILGGSSAIFRSVSRRVPMS